MPRVVLNLQEMRAKRAADAAIIVDGEGNEHVLAELTLDSYLALIDIMHRLQAVRTETPDDAGIEAMVALVREMKEVVQTVLPTFPVSGLSMDELMLVVNTIEAHMPGSAPAGEAQSPESST